VCYVDAIDGTSTECQYVQSCTDRYTNRDEGTSTSKARAIKLSEARSTFRALVNDVYRTHDRVIVEKSGIPVAAIVSVADLERLDRFERERDERFKIIDEIRARFADVDPEELEREAVNAIAAVRAKKRSGTAERTAS
jgi:prevent-host-death family protein